MKIIIYKIWTSAILFLILIVGASLWSCDEDEAGKISVSPQRLPTVTSIDPVSGILGTSVTITGTNFTDVLEDIELKFNGETAVVTESSETAIIAIIPSKTTTGALSLRIGATVLPGGGPTFTVPLPEVTSYDVSSGILGTAVVITGANFSPELANNAVSFNGISAVVTESSSTALTTSVPFGASTGAVLVTVDGQDGIGPVFTVPLPTISGYDITTGPTGATVTITGTNFSASMDENVVSFFDGIEAEVTAATETTIVTSVPAGASTGPISVNVGGQVASGDDFTVTATTLIISLDSNDDDVEEVVLVDPASSDPEAVLGFMDLGSSDLELGEISDDQGLVSIGLRFNNVAIPQGATVTNVTIQFNCDKEGADPVEVTIYGENVGDAAAYDGTSGELTARPLTTANAVWDIPEWVAAGDRGEAQRTVDLSGIVQEIVNRGDWSSGNSMNFIIQNTGASANVTVDDVGREAENYSDSSPEDGAELTINFTQ